MYRHCILGDGNADEFQELTDECKKRGVRLQHTEMPGGARIFRIPEADLDKLPKDEDGPYLGDDTSGHTLSKLRDEVFETYRKEWKGSDWVDSY